MGQNKKWPTAVTLSPKLNTVLAIMCAGFWSGTMHRVTSTASAALKYCVRWNCGRPTRSPTTSDQFYPTVADSTRGRPHPYWLDMHLRTSGNFCTLMHYCALNFEQNNLHSSPQTQPLNLPVPHSKILNPPLTWYQQLTVGPKLYRNHLFCPVCQRRPNRYCRNEL